MARASSAINPGLIDRAVSIGALMGEERDLVGMGIVAASALNRAQDPVSYLSRSAALGDVFSAPHKASSMVGSLLGSRLPDTGLARQYSTTLNTPQTRNAFDAFRVGTLATLGVPVSVGPYADRLAKANVALDVAVKARDLGIDLGYGITNYGSGWQAGQRAGVGRNPARYGAHYAGPFEMGEQVPTASDFAARFAAAAALTGISLPDSMVPDITAHATPGQIMAAASVMQRQAHDYMSDQLGEPVFPGLDYSDLVQPTGFGAVDVPDITGQLGIDPVGAQGFANTFGITPTNDYESIGLASPIGRVDRLADLPDLTPSYDFSSVTAGTAFDPLNSISVPDYGPAPDVMSQFDGPTYADITAGIYPGATDFSVSTQDFTPSIDAYSPAMSEMGQLGYHTGFGDDPYGGTPDFSAPSLTSRMNEDAQFGRASEFGQGIGYRSTDLNDNAIASRLNNELGPKTSPQLATPSLDTQSMYAGDWEDKLGPPQTTPQKATQATASQSWSDLGLPDSYAPHNYGAFSLAPTPAADLPAVTAHPASMPSLGPAIDIHAAPSIARAAPDYSGLVGSTYGVGQPLGGFMDAMANPSMAASFGQPVQRNAGFGDLMGATNLGRVGLSNPFAGFSLASLGGLFGGDNGLGGAMVPNGVGGWRQADAIDAMSSPDIANRLSSPGFSLGGLLGGLFGGGGFGGEGGYYGGGNNGPGSSLGDGSYADKAGFSDNNPQGIL